MAVTLQNISDDTGEVFDAVDGGTTAVTGMITRAEEFLKLQTGTTTGYDAILRPLADSMVITQVMGGIDPVNKTIGTLSVGDKDLRNMQRIFKEESNRAAIVKGISLDGLSIIFKDTRDA